MVLWTERILLNQNWILILFFLYSTLILFLKIIDPVQFRFLVRVLKYKEYERRYLLDKNFNVLKLFYILLIILISISFSFLILICENIFFNQELSFYVYLKNILVFKIFIIFRFLFLKILNKNLKLFQPLSSHNFKFVIFYFYIFFLIMCFLSISYIQNLISSDTMKILITSLFVCFSIYHLFIYKDEIKYSSRKTLYLFYYICAFKIAPWLWLSKIFNPA